jgi:predicted CXXCH cytochrome family protein
MQGPMAAINCTVCHDPHNAAGTKSQLRKPINDLCLGCHPAIKDIKTHAPQAAADATCASCHMPEGQHTFKKPAK